jgi:glycosyltransferase involved in cell wall biosynthesis
MMPTADICMLLEGTYPYVRGGVSSWVHQIISGLSEYTFSLVFIGGCRADYGELCYKLPDNVVHLEQHFLDENYQGLRPRRMRLSDSKLVPVRRFHNQLAFINQAQDQTLGQQEIERSVNSMIDLLEKRNGLQLKHFLFGSSTWDYFREAYMKCTHNASFIKYFWTLRSMHGPIFKLARVARDIPQARAYHAVSTGHAGLLGVFLVRKRGRPLMLSEHGIYTKERKIDLNQAEWLDQAPSGAYPDLDETSTILRGLWVRFFERLGWLTYRSANPIISLYTGSRQRQLQDGAAPDRTRIIVNGIDISRFEKVYEQRPQQIPPVIGLIGRVVSIKDIKTFIRTIGVVSKTLTNIEGWVVGSADEEPEYAEECKDLARSLGIANRVRFLGHRDVSEVLPHLGLLMLTSISEAQPLVVLEAFASGLPAVTTDVGACREQIEGRTDEDRALGKAGRVAPIADVNTLSRAAAELLTNPVVWMACQKAGLERVRRYYTQTAMLESYRAVYQKALEVPWPA